MKATHSLLETHVLAREFTEKITQTRALKSVVVGFYGDLGAGKTSFVQGIAQALGINIPVASPTFVLEKIYTLDQTIQNRFSCLVHIDAYRMDSPDEAAHIDFDEIIVDPQNLVCVEWPERIASKMPAEHIRIICAFVDEQTRTFDISE